MTTIFTALMAPFLWASRLGKPTLPEIDFTIGLHPEDDPEHIKLERERHWQFRGAEGVISLVILALTILSGYMTFEGVLAERERDLGISFESGLHALMVATGVTMSLFGGWLVVLKLTPLMRTQMLWMAAYLFAIVFTLWSISVSTWYNFVGLSGQSSLIMYMADATDRMSRAVDAVTAQASEARAVIPALESVSASTCASHQAEVTQGLGTGGRGVGPYSQALLSACTATQKAVESLKATSGKAEEQAAQIGEVLRALSALVVDRKIAITEREDAFRKGAAEVEALLRSIRNTGMRKTAEASLAALKSSVLELPVDGGSFGEKQRALLGAVRQQMTGATSALEKVLAGLGGGDAVVLERTERVTLTDVSLRYLHRSIPNIALAIGLDVFPLAMMTFLALAAAGRKRRKAKSRFNGFLEVDPAVTDELIDEVKTVRSKQGDGRV